MRRLNSTLLLLGLCALTQTQALRVFARTALPASQELDDEDPEPQGRLFSIVRDTEPARYPAYDSKPIIISPPQASYPPYPPYYHQPHPAPPPPPPPAPYPVPHPIPIPVPVPPPIPPTIIRPIVSRPHHHHGGWGGGYGGFPPFINITYSPIIAAATTRAGLGNRVAEEQQLNDLSQLSQLLFAQGQAQPLVQQLPQQLPQLSQYQQLQQISQLQNQALPANMAYQPFNNNVNANQEGSISLAQFQQLLANYVPAEQLVDDVDMNAEQDQRKSRRSQKAKRKSKKSKKTRVHPQTIYLAIDPVQGQVPVDAQAQVQAQADVMQA